MTIERPEILIVTTSSDPASDAVERQLAAGGHRYARLNTEDLPIRATASLRLPSCIDGFRWWLGDRAISMASVRRIWFRRHRLPKLPAEVTRPHAEYCLREAEWFLRGALLSLAESVTPADWMSHPLALQRAESKILQLQVATRLGLPCPATLISTDPGDIRRFFRQQNGRIVAKPIRLGYFDYGASQAATFTTSVSEADLEDDDALSLAPVIYQQHLDKAVDVRVTIVDTAIYAAAIHSQAVPAARTDWRATTEELPHTRHTLPRTLADQCLRMMQDLSLKFGALDFVLTPEGQYVFLEVNPNGQWLWIEDRLGYPIAQDIASWLTFVG